MFFDLPSGAKVDKYMAGMPTTSWLTWTNPRNEYSNAIILAAGGGGVGGTGNTSRGGGGGGGGGFGHIYCPLSLLPDTLYINVGSGSVSAVPGNPTYVNLYPSIATANNLITCSGGTNGKDGALAGASGPGGPVTINNTLGIAQGYTGGAGSAGVTVTTGTATSSLPITGSPIYGGAGGSWGGTGVGGGMTSVSSLYPSIAGATGANNGSDGFVIQKPFTVFGGCGAAASAGVGYKGGNGIMGSGGGGGGGVSGGGGQGGKGGDGFVIIICY
jgi:hypothetical protein